MADQLVEQKPKRNWKVRLALWLLIPASFTLIFWSFGKWADSDPISPKLKALPAEIARKHGFVDERNRGGARVNVGGDSVRKDDGVKRKKVSAAKYFTSAKMELYDDFLTRAVKADPTLRDRSELYRKLRKLIGDPQTQPPRFYEPTPEFAHWYPGKGPLTREMRAWLVARPELPELLREFAHQEMLPGTNRRDLMEHYIRLESPVPPFADELIYMQSAWLLSAIGRSRIEESDVAGAVSDYLLILLMAQKIKPFSMGHSSVDDTYGSGITSIREGVTSDFFGIAEREQILSFLRDIETDKLFPQEEIINDLEMQFLFRHYGTSLEYSQPWKSKTFGYMEDFFGEVEAWRNVRVGSTSFEVPRLGVYARHCWIVIGNKKEGDQFIREFDIDWQDGINHARNGYAAFRGRQPAGLFEAYSPASNHGVNKYAFWVYERAFRTVAHLNLLRAALELEADHARALEDRKNTAAHWEPSYWSDPFVEKGVMRLDDETSPTLIWSIGPDLKDQNGGSRYVSSDEVNVEGDIIFELNAN